MYVVTESPIVPHPGDAVRLLLGSGLPYKLLTSSDATEAEYTSMCDVIYSCVASSTACVLLGFLSVLPPGLRVAGEVCVLGLSSTGNVILIESAEVARDIALIDSKVKKGASVSGLVEKAGAEPAGKLAIVVLAVSGKKYRLKFVSILGEVKEVSTDDVLDQETSSSVLVRWCFPLLG